MKQDRRSKRGLVLVNTGALGVILHMLGHKKRVALIQFLKHVGGQWGEIRALKTGDGWTSKDIDESQAKALHGMN
jgi:cob(I)alamin adenosyltransferase